MVPSRVLVWSGDHIPHDTNADQTTKYLKVGNIDNVMGSSHAFYDWLAKRQKTYEQSTQLQYIGIDRAKSAEATTKKCREEVVVDEYQAQSPRVDSTEQLYHLYVTFHVEYPIYKLKKDMDLIYKLKKIMTEIFFDKWLCQRILQPTFPFTT